MRFIPGGTVRIIVRLALLAMRFVSPW